MLDDAQMMVLELGGKGYSCAQIALAGALRLLGRENTDLIRSMDGLAQGVGCSGEICGALAGGVCLIALHTSKGHDAEDSLPNAQPLMTQLVEWCRENCRAGGAITCDAILGYDSGPSGGRGGMDAVRCGALVAQTWTRAVSLLVENGIDPTIGRDCL